MTTTYQKNYDFGIKNEELIRDMFNTKYKMSLDKPDNRYCFYDLIDNDYKVIFEVKSRNNSVYRYPTTIIGYDKIENFDDFNEEHEDSFLFVMIFVFIEGIYYFIHNPEYNYIRNDIYGSSKKYAFIPVDQLKKIDQLYDDICSTSKYINDAKYWSKDYKHIKGKPDHIILNYWKSFKNMCKHLVNSVNC